MPLVCSACGQEGCANGFFMCEKAKGASFLTKPSSRKARSVTCARCGGSGCGYCFQKGTVPSPASTSCACINEFGHPACSDHEPDCFPAQDVELCDLLVEVKKKDGGNADEVEGFVFRAYRLGQESNGKNLDMLRRKLNPRICPTCDKNKCLYWNKAGEHAGCGGQYGCCCGGHPTVSGGST